MRKRLLVALGVLVVLAAAGVFGVAWSTGRIWPVPFKDDAPANREVSSGELPLTFIDLKNNAEFDLAQYRGKKNVVLVFVRGVPYSSLGVF